MSCLAHMEQLYSLDMNRREVCEYLKAKHGHPFKFLSLFSFVSNNIEMSHANVMLISSIKIVMDCWDFVSVWIYCCYVERWRTPCKTIVSNVHATSFAAFSFTQK